MQFIYIYINMNIRIYHESICIYTSCAQSVYLICHCQLLRWLLRQGPTSSFNSTGSQLQHRQWRISRWSLWRFSSVGRAQQKPTPKLQRWTATVQTSYCWWFRNLVHNHRWDVKETPVNNEKNYQPQQVQDFFHQQYSNRYIRRVYENMST